MKKPLRSTLFLGLLACTLAFTEPPPDHPSLASEVLETYPPKPGDDPAVAATAFLAALTEELSKECIHPLDCEHRAQWTNVPPGANEDGVRLGDLDETQLQRATDLLATVLSPEGYAKVRDVLLADDKLLRNGRPRRGFGAENFWLGIFGDPEGGAKDGREWGLQLDGHHIALNLSFKGEEMTMSPTFIGTQPAKYRRGEATIVPLRELSELAYGFVAALSAGQRQQAIQSPRRGRIAAGAGRDGYVPEPIGLACADLDENQGALLTALIEAYVRDLPAGHMQARLHALREEVPEMTFAWSGPTAKRSDISYRLQGPSVIIEFACQDLGGDPLNHLHSMYRNPENEYGASLGR